LTDGGLSSFLSCLQDTDLGGGADGAKHGGLVEEMG
jgi:hypothetical protein